MAAAKYKKHYLSDEIYCSLKTRIMSGELAICKEESLAKDYNVSRTPLRKALTQLTSEGYLQRCPDRTLRTPKLSTEYLKQGFHIRKLLETAAAREACARATEQDIVKLEFLIAEEREAQEKLDSMLVTSLDRSFHGHIAKTSGNVFYSDFIEQLNIKATLFLTLSKTLSGEIINAALDEHAEILEGIKSASVERTARAMEAHLTNVELRVLKALGD